MSLWAPSKALGRKLGPALDLDPEPVSSSARMPPLAVHLPTRFQGESLSGSGKGGPNRRGPNYGAQISQTWARRARNQALEGAQGAFFID